MKTQWAALISVFALVACGGGGGSSSGGAGSQGVPVAAASFGPSIGAVDVPVGTSLVVVFSKAIQRGTGTIVLKTASGAVVETYPVASSTRLAISDRTLTIDPNQDLAYGTTYEIDISGGAIKGVDGEDYAGSANYVFTTASGPCVPKIPVTVQMFGDSTQTPVEGEGFLQEEMDARFGLGAVQIINAAVNGTNSQHLIDGTDGLNTPWPSSVTADIAVVNHGINDQEADTPLAVYQANVEAFAAGPAVMVLETQSPTFGQPYANPAYSQVLRSVAAASSTTLADVETYVLGLPNWPSYLDDGVHLGEALNRLVAHNVLAPTLIPIVARLRCE